MYFRARYYNPLSGEFLSRDPMDPSKREIPGAEAEADTVIGALKNLMGGRRRFTTPFQGRGSAESDYELQLLSQRQRSAWHERELPN